MLCTVDVASSLRRRTSSLSSWCPPPRRRRRRRIMEMELVFAVTLLLGLFSGIENQFTSRSTGDCSPGILSSTDSCIELQSDRDAIYVAKGDAVELVCAVKCNRSFSDVYVYFTLVRTVQIANSTGSECFDVGFHYNSSTSSIRLSLTVTSLNQSGKLVCRSSDGLISPPKHLEVLKARPMKPELATCLVANWTRMTCYWTPPLSVQKLHTGDQQLSRIQVVWNSSHELRSSSQKCKFAGNSGDWDGCGIDGDVVLNSEYCLRYNVTSRFLGVSVLSDVTCIRPRNYVQPKAPEIVNHAAVNNTYVIIQWQPIKTPYFEQITSVTYWLNVTALYRNVRGSENIFSSQTFTERKQWHILPIESPYRQPESWCTKDGDRDVKSLNGTNVTSAFVPVLPFSQIYVTVRSKLSVSSYWSEPNQPVYTFFTNTSVPCRQPTVAPNVYVTGNQAAVVYWKKIPEKYQCGPGFHYQIITHHQTYSAPSPAAGSQSVTVDPTVTSAAVSISHTTLSLTILSANDLGQLLAQPPTVNVKQAISGSADSVGRVSAEGLGNSVTIYWLRHNDDDVSLSSSPPLTSLTFYWCTVGQLTTRTCSGDIYWHRHVTNSIALTSAPEVRYTVTTESSFYRYQVGVAVNNGSIQWSDCINTVNSHDVTMPENVRLDALPPTWFGAELYVTWSEPACLHGYARIVAIVMEYCLINDSAQCIDPVEVAVPLLKASSSESNRHSHTLRGLMQGKTYGVRLYSSSTDSRSRGSPMVTASTPTRLLTAGILAGVIVGAVLTALFSILLLSVAWRRWLRNAIRRQRKLEIIVPHSPQTQHPQEQPQQLQQEPLVAVDSDYSPYCATTKNRHASSVSTIRAGSRDSGYHDDMPSHVNQSTSPLLGAPMCFDRQLSTDTCHTTDDNMLFFSDEKVKYVRFEDLIILPCGGADSAMDGKLSSGSSFSYPQLPSDKNHAFKSNCTEGDVADTNLRKFQQLDITTDVTSSLSQIDVNDSVSFDDVFYKSSTNDVNEFEL